MKCWRSFSKSANDDVWGSAFRWAKSGTRRTDPPSTVTVDGKETIGLQDTIDAFMDTFVPVDPDAGALGDLITVDRTEPYDAVTECEVQKAIWRISPNKAPGNDGVTAMILRKSWPLVKGKLTRLYDDCVRNGEFPGCWKSAKIILIPKGENKDPRQTKSYRPISLLSVLAKALETLIVHRLESETDLNSIREQHGFTSEKSTTTAMTELIGWADAWPNRHVLALFLDITGAFDNVKWISLIAQIKKMNARRRTVRILQSYLVGRQASITIEGITRTRTMTMGCPQGSQLGPTLWKVATARLAESPLEKGIKWVFYADDVAIMAGAARKETAISKLERSFNVAAEWVTEFGLIFSPGKSQTMSIKGGLKPQYQVRLGNDLVTATSPIKYLGVKIDYIRTFWQHIESLAKKIGQPLLENEGHDVGRMGDKPSHGQNNISMRLPPSDNVRGRDLAGRSKNEKGNKEIGKHAETGSAGVYRSVQNNVN